MKSTNHTAHRVVRIKPDPKPRLRLTHKQGGYVVYQSDWLDYLEKRHQRNHS